MTALDHLDWVILELLQTNARMPFSEIGRQVGLSQPAVAERVRRLEAEGVICGYHAEINTELIGHPITAIIRISTPGGIHSDRAAAHAASMREIIECHKVTGSDCFVMKVLVKSIKHLESVIDQLSPFGTLNSSIVLDSPIKSRIFTEDSAR
ncbi:MAG: Lrp/AsnC family transcriptional regulator [Anaerolineae bacterium]|nr:Lrp/AsnC family transcriptional regulator [Anaerolineae bacterium]